MDPDAGYDVSGDSDNDNSPNGHQTPRQPSPDAELPQFSPRTLLRLRQPPEQEFIPEDHEVSSSGSDSDDGLSQPLKRSADDADAYRPLKRRKGPANAEYLALLNEDIRDAAATAPSAAAAGDDALALAPSQVGLTQWTAEEKHALFEGLTRLGRDDVAGVTARLGGSKSVVEVGRYLRLLEDEHADRLRSSHRPVLMPAEYPAAVELSQQCCHALEEAADALSLRQETREQQREQARWEAATTADVNLWNLTPDVAGQIRRAGKDRAPLASLDLFRLTTWLRLSQRFFMNSAIPGNNWAHVDNVPPSIWATAFEDYHSLAVSVTRRLVQTTLYAAMSRIRAKREARPQTRSLVSRRDVDAAVASLGMKADSSEFWRTSARRLRLDVVNDEVDDETDELPSMTYDEVEKKLSDTPEEEEATTEKTDKTAKQEAVEEAEEEEEQVAEDSDSDSLSGSDEEHLAIKAEVDEVLRFSVADFSMTPRLKDGLHSRVATERERDRLADQHDQYAGYKEELDMWKVLQRPAPPEIPRVAEPEPPSRSNRDVEGMYLLARDWRRNTRYRGEWEPR